VAAHSYARLYFSILQDARIKPSDKLILLALQKWGYETHQCFPSDDTIARQAAIGRRTVQRGLDRLEDFGFIKGLEKRKPPCILRSPHPEPQELRRCGLPPR
jgi:DNA-binding MarR family transcriptional regulator